MAQRVVVQLVDDLDGQDIDEGAGETVAFSLDEVRYEIDVRSQHANEFHAVLQPFIVKARRRRGPGGRRRSSARRAPGSVGS